MTAQTQSQKMAQSAYSVIAARFQVPKPVVGDGITYPESDQSSQAEIPATTTDSSNLDTGSKLSFDKFASFAREFPALVHSCGLAQAVAFAKAKGAHQLEYLNDLTHVLKAVGHFEATSPDSLSIATREHSISAYIRLSRDALLAAGWMKRFVEARGEE